MREFKVGDKVRVRGFDNLGTLWDGEVGKIIGVEKNLARVKFKEHGLRDAFVHRSALRRLKSKARRSVWVRERDIPAPLHSGHAVISSAELVGESYIEFREVKRKAVRRG